MKIDVQQCSDSLISVQELEQVSPLQESLQGNLNSSASEKSMSTAQISSSCVSPVFPTTEMCDRYQNGLTEETSTPKQSILLRDRLPVNRFQCKESDREQPTDGTALGQSYKRSLCSNLNSSASRMYQGYLTALLNPDTAEVPISKSLEMQFPKSGTDLNGAVSARDTLELPSLEKDYFWLDRPTALSTTANSRPPGLCKAERQWRKLGLIGKQEVASPDFLEKLFDIPNGWTSPQESKTAIQLSEDAEKQLGIPWIGESLRSPSSGYSTSTPSVPKAKESQDNYSTSTPTTLKAISLWQPWASLIPLGLKHYETRSWKTNYRGKLLICSTVNNSKHYREYLKIKDELQLPAWNEENFPHGCAISPKGMAEGIAICDLTDCVEMTPEFIAQQSQTEILCGDWQPGRYAWKLENIQPITEPFAVKGKQGLFNIPSTNLECYLKKSTPLSKKTEDKNSDLLSLPSWMKPGAIAFIKGSNDEWEGVEVEILILPEYNKHYGCHSPYTLVRQTNDYYKWTNIKWECLQPYQKTVLPVKQTVSTPVEDQTDPVLMVNSTVSTNEQTETESVLMVNSSTVSTKKRSRGEGTGRIQWRTITKKNGKQYQQAWYDWQLKQGGKTISKSTYISKRLLPKIQQLEMDKAPVREILQVLGIKL